MNVEHETAKLQIQLEQEIQARVKVENELRAKENELKQAHINFAKLYSVIEKDLDEQTSLIVKSEFQLRNVFDKHPLPLLICDLDSEKILKANLSSFDFLGYSIEELEQMEISNLSVSDKRLLSHLKCKEKEISRDIEWQFRSKKGAVKDFCVSSSPIQYYGENSYLLLLQDITEKKISERVLKEKEKKYRELVETVSDIIYRCNYKGEFIYVNPKAVHMCGFIEEELLGKHFSDLVKKDHVQRVVNFYKIQFENQQRSTYLEFPILTKEGKEVWVGQTVDIYKLENGGLEFIALTRDISERKKMELELISAKELAENSSRSKELFMANMSHEIRTPMNAIIGMSDLLMSSSISERQENYVNAIQNSAENLLVIINDILDFYKIESGKLIVEKIDCNLENIIENSIKLLELKAEEKGLVLKAEKLSGSIQKNIITDPTRLGQILINLLSNAVKFTNTGEVCFTCKLLEDNPTDQRILFSVADTGIGIKPENLKHIFDSFSQADETTSRKYGGTGLGLSISKRLVEKLGGKLQVKSTVGQGSEFSFEIKFQKGKANTILPEEQILTENSFLQDLRVLLVEDHDINRYITQTILESWKCKVDWAENGLIAVEKVKNNYYDIILMDMRMPELDGIGATEIIREELHSKVPIIALTANAIKGDSEKCIKAGMNDYLSKPFKKNDLYEKLTALMGDTNAFSDQNNLVTEYKEKIEESPKDIKSMNTENYVDLSGLEKITYGDEVFKNKMISMFVDDTPLQINEMENALAKKDLATIKKTAHKLKPSVKYLAVISLHELIRVVELTDNLDIEFQTKAKQLITQLKALVYQLKGKL